MGTNDWSNSEVRDVWNSEYDVTKSKYMEAYSFVMSWGWRRVNIAEKGEPKVFVWVDEGGEYKCENVYQAQAIQRLRILTQ